jgi:transglutaminase-like putative cysteine protease
VSIVEDRPLIEEPAAEEAALAAAAEHLPDDAGAPAEPEKAVRAGMVIIAAALATCSSAWMASRLFRGPLPMLVALAGIGVGAGLTFLSARLGRSAIVQYAVLPVAAVVGAILATSAAGGGSLPTLVVDAIRGGGLQEPPIPFDPGWRFLFVLLFAAVSGAGASLGVSMRRPKLAVGFPLPVALGAAVIQPKGSELVSSAVAIVFLVGALAVAYGADLASDGVVGGGFETRRLLRGTALLTAVVVALVGLAQTDFLFPVPDKDEVIPPQRPPSPPPTPDRELFTIKTDRPGPWRVGVLDVYQDNAFLLPSVDKKRVLPVPKDGRVAPAARETYKAELTLVDVKGQTLLTPASTAVVSGLGDDLSYDPRTQLVKLAKTSIRRDTKYTVEAEVPADGKAMAAAPDPNPLIAKEFAAMPPAPPGVVEVLTKADAATTNRFDRLQFVRQALYSNVIAAGGGRPVDILPAKVDEMLKGGEASPFEINAAEVMLARWAGVPARLGFGFYGGEAKGEGVVSFRPRHGAAWLEAYFEGLGWVPIIGTPPKAKASLSNEQKKQDPKVVPSEELALTVYVAVDRPSIRLLYELVRFYAIRVVPIFLALLALILGYPAIIKLLRSRKRRQWAAEHGLLQRIVVAYAEMRDRCYDLNAGDPRHSPIEFLADLSDDDEHQELAWLVTRAVWGDLHRDLQISDAEAAEEMAASVQKRLDREQTGLNRLLAWTSRVSLRDPWTDEIPNIWFTPRAPQPAPLPAAEGTRRLRLPRLRLPGRRRVAGAAAIILAVFALGGCGGRGDDAKAPSTFPNPIAPQRVLDRYDIERRPEIEGEFKRPKGNALVTDGRVFTVRDGDTIQGSIQISVLRPDVDGDSWEVQRGVMSDLGAIRAFTMRHYGTIHLEVMQTAEEQVFVWFPPEHNVIQLFLMRKTFDDATKVVLAVIAHQRSAAAGSPEPLAGTPVTTIPIPPPTPQGGGS